MIVKCNGADQDKVLSYIGNDYPNCIYLFLDLKKYGMDSGYIDVFCQEEGSTITAILLRYYSCLHVFSRENLFDVNEIVAFIELRRLTMLYCTESTSRLIYEKMHNKAKASITRGWVARIKAIDKCPKGFAVKAKKEDFPQIASLIFEDEDIGRSYKYDDLVRQLVERNEEGYGRNLVIKDNNIVIAHACTNAELGSIAVVAELLVRKEYRKKGYASEIWRDLCGRLLSEGKEVYSFYYSEESRNLHKHIGFYEICDWAKVVISF